MLHITLSGSN